MIAAAQFVLLLALILLLPVKWAADFADANYSNWGASMAAAVAGPLVSVFIYWVFAGWPGGFFLAFLAGIATYVLIFGIPFRKIPAFTLVVVALQIAVWFGLGSFGVSLVQFSSGRS